MVCISCLELSGSPSHLRYLLRRLRQHLPSVDVPVLIGFWPDGEEILHDERRRVPVGADYYTSSLRDAVDACLEVGQASANNFSPSRPALWTRWRVNTALDVSIPIRHTAIAQRQQKRFRRESPDQKLTPCTPK